MSFLFCLFHWARMETRVISAHFSLKEWPTLCLGLFCSALPWPAMPVSGIFSHCYHFSHFFGSDISFRLNSLHFQALFWSTLHSFAVSVPHCFLSLAVSFTVLFFHFALQLFFVFIWSFMLPRLWWFPPLPAVWVNGWVLLDLAQWARLWSCVLSGWACPPLLLKWRSAVGSRSSPEL